MRYVGPYLSLFLMLWFVTGSSHSAAQQVPVSSPDHCFPGFEQSVSTVPAMLARGVNFPNWSPRYEGFQPPDVMLLALKKRGLTHLRLPIDGEELMPIFENPKMAKSYLKALQASIIRLQDLGFVLSLDMHPGGQFKRLHKDNPEAGFEQLVAAWDRISSLLKSMEFARTDPDRLFLELLNEPAAAEDVWWQQAQRLADHLRASWPQTWLIAGPGFYQRYEVLARHKPLKGEKLIYAVHYYDPFPFTHQAISWDDTSPLQDIAFLPFPLDREHGAVKAQLADLKRLGKQDAVSEIENAVYEPWTAQRIAQDLQIVGDWSKAHKVPVLVNEFGVLNHAVDEKSRLYWLKAVAQGAQQACLGWTHWDFSDGFGMIMYPEQELDQAVLKALLGD